jgi:hypothetical protein
MTMAEVTKAAGVTAWTGAWRLPTVERDHHQRAVLRRRLEDCYEVVNLRSLDDRC